MPRSIQPQVCPYPPPPIRKQLMDIMAAAPPVVRRAMCDLMRSIKAGLEAAGKTPVFIDARAKVFDWRSLLPMLSDIRSKLDQPIAARLRRRGRAKEELARMEQRFSTLQRSHEEQSLTMQILYALVNVGGEFQTSEEVLEQSADVLIEFLEADLFVCRLRDASGEWINVAANTLHGTSTPILVRAMEESIPGHPVMKAVAEKQWSYVLSNNLQSSERGGESYDCVAYQEGYRSRLAFILRGHDTRPFGLIMLYSRVENYFSHYDHSFLSDCTRIVSLTVGSRLEIGRDALAKAAGGMAHVGNNALSVIKNCLELVKEDMDLVVTHASPEDRVKLANIIDLAREVELIGCALGGVERLRGAIANLLAAVDNPRIMHYIRGEEVLDLDPASAPTCDPGR